MIPMTPTVINVPFSLGDRVYIIQEVRMKKPKRVAYNVQEGIVESIHIGRKLAFNKIATDSYVRVRSTLAHALFAPIPLERARNYIFGNYFDAMKRLHELSEED